MVADYCSDFLTDGWADTVAERAADYVSAELWSRLTERRRKHCRALARMAKRILEFKDQLHGWAGALVTWVLSLFGVRVVVREFAGELAKNIPIGPIDAKMAAVSRGLQVTGVALCISGGEDITKCQCFIDLALDETKSRVKRILAAAMEDWVKLAMYPPTNSARGRV
jgi:hypothetical protein